jgi:hypothetical protein
VTSAVVWILFEFNEKIYVATRIVLPAFHFAWSSDLSDLILVSVERKFLSDSLICSLSCFSCFASVSAG